MGFGDEGARVASHAGLRQPEITSGRKPKKMYTAKEHRKEGFQRWRRSLCCGGERQSLVSCLLCIIEVYLMVEKLCACCGQRGELFRQESNESPTFGGVSQPCCFAQQSPITALGDDELSIGDYFCRISKA